MSLILNIVTPGKTVFSDVVDQVILPTSTGEITILPGHIPLITELETGELQVLKGSNQTFLAVDRGFARVLGDVTSVLAGAAVNIADVDLQAIEEAHRSAQKALLEAKAQKQIALSEVADLEALVRFSFLQQYLKQRRR